MSTLTIRRLRDGDSLDELSALLRRAFARLGDSGLNCRCVTQNAELTRQRIGHGDCFVALDGTRMVGTVTLQTADRDAAIALYRQPEVASVHQLAVAPELQGRGLGSKLLRTAQDSAWKRGSTVLALDTPEPAHHLHAFYRGHGFVHRMRLQLAGRSYRSLVFDKALRSAAGAIDHFAPIAWWPARHPAEWASTARTAGHARVETSSSIGTAREARSERSAAGFFVARERRGLPA